MLKHKTFMTISTCIKKDLRSRTEKRQQRAKRQTQLRLVARRKLKDSKALHRLKLKSTH